MVKYNIRKYYQENNIVKQKTVLVLTLPFEISRRWLGKVRRLTWISMGRVCASPSMTNQEVNRKLPDLSVNKAYWKG